MWRPRLAPLKALMVRLVGMTTHREFFYKRELELRLSMSYGPAPIPLNDIAAVAAATLVVEDTVRTLSSVAIRRRTDEQSA